MSSQNDNIPPKSGGSKVFNVQTKDDINKVINSQTGGQVPDGQNPPSGNQQPPKQSGGGPEGQSQTNTAALSKVVSPPSNNTNSNVSPQANVNTTSNNQGDVGVGGNASNNIGGSDAAVNTAPDNDDIDIEGIINKSEAETAEIDKDKKARQEKMELLTKAIEAVRGPKAFERLLFNNVETGEVVGTKIRYVKDYDGKTAYDYMNDPIVQEHIEFVVPEGDPQDGSPVDRQISFFWKKPTF